MNRRWIFIGLFGLSLVGNLFAAGYWLGEIRRPEPRPRYQESLADPAIHSMKLLAERLPPEARGALREEIRTLRRVHWRDFERMHQLAGEIATLMTAADVDVPALKQAYAEMRALSGNARAVLQDRFAELVADLPLADRATLVAELRTLTPHHDKHHEKKKERD